MTIGMIGELSQLSLLDERDDLLGFRDLASACQIAKLLNHGVRLSEIIRAVSEMRISRRITDFMWRRQLSAA
jgi:hypothetical protein